VTLAVSRWSNTFVEVDGGEDSSLLAEGVSGETAIFWWNAESRDLLGWAVNNADVSSRLEITLFVVVVVVDSLFNVYR
jgi:hypothetical protein